MTDTTHQQPESPVTEQTAAHRSPSLTSPAGSPDAASPLPPTAATPPATPPAVTPAASSSSVADEMDDAVTPDQARMALRRVKDPELNLNIVDLGLVYEVNVVGSTITVDMSLTSPGCPSGAEIMEQAERQLREMPGVTDVTINLVWTPFWSPDRIEPRVRAYLGI